VPHKESQFLLTIIHYYLIFVHELTHGVLDNWIELDLAKDDESLAKFISSFPLPNNMPEQISE
jgi:hypothetical protein